MTDVLLYDTPDGGEINVVEGRVELTDELDVMAYLCLFGGNERDSGSDGDKVREWWGNKIESLPSRRYRSEYQHMVTSLPITPANLKRFEDAAGRDLQALIDEKLVTNILAVCRITAPKTLELELRMEIDGRLLEPLRFVHGSTAS